MKAKTFFITGAASGIGRALAELVVARGHRAALADIDEAGVQALSEELGQATLPLALDIRDEGAWHHALDRAWSELGGVDVLVNDAALFDAQWAREQSEASMRELADVNLFGLIRGTRLGLERFETQGHGHIINIGSVAGFTPVPGQAFYAATKHAVRAWHHTFAIENRDSPVDFTLICPGAVDTPMIQAHEGAEPLALAFSGPVLTARQVAGAIYRAARKRPREVAIPRVGGGLLRILGNYPGLVGRVVPAALRRGIRVMRARADEPG